MLLLGRFSFKRSFDLISKDLHRKSNDSLETIKMKVKAALAEVISKHQDDFISGSKSDDFVKTLSDIWKYKCKYTYTF